jgi:carbamoyl-phosphate synthase large subunit
VTELRVLMLGARRRNYFILALRESARLRNIRCFIIGADVDALDPFRLACDGFFILPPHDSDLYDHQLNALLVEKDIDLIVAWNDAEISTLADLATRGELKCSLGLPPNDVVITMWDKLVTHRWLVDNKIPTPELLSLSDTQILTEPIVVKPRFGQGGVGVFVCNRQTSLHEAIAEQSSDYILQRFVRGPEFTVDVISYLGNCISHVPRRRLKVRGGEVLIARVEMREDIEQLTRRICRQLNISAVFNFQVIAAESGLQVIELNPRFGGGSDLSIEAGADLAGAYIDIYHLKVSPQNCRPIENGLVMTRRLVSEFIRDV